MFSAVPCCGLQMGCQKNLAFCLQQDLIQDPTVMAWMRMTPPSSLSLYSEARAEATKLLVVQESYLAFLNSKLADARREVEAAYKVVEDILVQIKNARLHITKSHASLAPVRCIPNEILRYILASLDPPEIPGRLGDILSLCCVSKRWNEVVKLTPELWTNWQLDFAHSQRTATTVWSDNLNPMTPGRLDKFFVKSMPRPLYFNIISKHPKSLGSSVETPPPVFDAIFQSMPRWSKFMYKCRVTAEQPCLCPQVYAQLYRGSSLRDLSWIPCKRWDVLEQDVAASPRLGSCQKLTLGVDTDILERLHVPVLSHLLLDDVWLDTQGLSSLAISLPNLLVLRCNNVRFHREATEVRTPIRFQKLHDFHLTCSARWPFDSNLAKTVIHDSTTLVNVYRNITQWKNLGRTPDLKPGIHISFLEFELDVNARPFCWDVDTVGLADWLGMTPNLNTVVLKWRVDHGCNDDNENNLLAANILHSMWASENIGLYESTVPCRRLKHVKCCGAICGEASTPASVTRVLLMAIENFFYLRSAERAQSSGTEPCLLSLSWRHTPRSIQLPDLVDAGFDELQGLLDRLPDEEVLSDDDVTEVSEVSDDYAWNGEDMDFDWSDEISSTDSGSDLEEEEEEESGNDE